MFFKKLRYNECALRGGYQQAFELLVGKKVGDEALKIAWAIAKKIEKYGQKGRYVMRDALPVAKQFFHEELIRAVAQARTGIKNL